jgi:hypothetical protein
MMNVGIVEMLIIVFIGGGGLLLLSALLYVVWKLIWLSKEIEAIKQSLAEVRQSLNQES